MTTSTKTLAPLLAALALAFAPVAASAQAELRPAIDAFNQGQFDRAAVILHNFIQDNGADANRAKAEYYLGQTFEKLGFYQSALYQYGLIVREGPAHPFYVPSAQGLVDVAAALDDDVIVPSVLNKEYGDAFQSLKPEYLHKVNYLVGVVSYRAGQLEDAKGFLTVVPVDSTAYAHARYLLAIVTIQQGRQSDQVETASRDAVSLFEEILGLDSKTVPYDGLAEIKDLARLGLARAYYGLGEYDRAVKYYEQVPRFSDYWDEALFENGWARFLNDDMGGALGSLQALHAPQFAGSFQPESWILKSTIYYQACLYDEAEAALDSFSKSYGGMKSKVTGVLEGDREFSWYYKLIDDPAQRTQLPRAVYTYIAGNKRMRGFRRYITSLEREKEALNSNPTFRGTRLAQEYGEIIDQQKNVLENVAGKFVKQRLADTVAQIQGFESQAELIKFENADASAKRLETGWDFRAALTAQNLERPSNPADDWEYWRFQGEFWIDEIGYYQFTLRSGCQKKEE